MDLIEEMKKNERPFGLLTDDKKELLRNIEIEDCRIFKSGGWTNCLNVVFNFENKYTYCIRADYHPEPEIERCEVFKGENEFRYKRDRDAMSLGIEIAVRIIDFIGYEYEGGRKGIHPRLFHPVAREDACEPAEIPKYVLFRKSK